MFVCGVGGLWGGGWGWGWEYFEMHKIYSKIVNKIYSKIVIMQNDVISKIHHVNDKGCHGDHAEYSSQAIHQKE